jgi:hypothetical protein
LVELTTRIGSPAERLNRLGIPRADLRARSTPGTSRAKF